MALLFVLATGLFVLFKPAVEDYRSDRSPSGDYLIVVQRYRPRFSAMPGQGADAPGTMRLYNRQGHLLHEADLPMVSLADHIEWGAGYVAVPGLLQWQLDPIP